MTLEAATAEIVGLDEDGERPESLVAAWQLGDFSVGSGLNRTYRLFEDGLFVFQDNPIHSWCKEGVATRVGTWEVDGDDILLREQRRIEVIGGEKVEDEYGECTREDAKIVVSVFDEPREKTLVMTDCPEEELEERADEIQALGANIECRQFSGDSYWTAGAETENWRDDWQEWVEFALKK